MTTVDTAEIDKFEEMAHEWWDLEGKFKPLHRMNPVRMGYIRDMLTGSPTGSLEGLRVLDIGCGGGILAEALAEAGADVTAIDRSDKIIGVAKAHQAESGSSVNYQVAATRDLVDAGTTFDAVCAMEVIEHVPDVPAFLAEAAALVKPGGGGKLFFSTINRTRKAQALAIFMAENVLRWVPRGTHDYEKCVKPSEVDAALRRTGMALKQVKGMAFSPVTTTWTLTDDVSVNYLGYGEKG